MVALAGPPLKREVPGHIESRMCDRRQRPNACHSDARATHVTWKIGIWCKGTSILSTTFKIYVRIALFPFSHLCVSAALRGIILIRSFNLKLVVCPFFVQKNFFDAVGVQEIVKRDMAAQDKHRIVAVFIVSGCAVPFLFREHAEPQLVQR